MKKVFYSFLSLALVFSLYSCGGGESETEETTEDLTTEEVEETTEEEAAEEVEEVNPFEGKTAVALRDSWISDKPGGKKEGVKWLKKFVFGNKLQMLGDSAKIGNGTYFKVKTPDGTEGWSSTWSIAPDAKVAVVVKDASIYKSPDITSVTSEKVPMGEIVVVLNNDMEIGFNEFFTKDKKSKGWIKAGSGLSESDTDLELAIMISSAEAQKDPEKKLAVYSEIVDNSSYAGSALYKGAIERKSELESEIANAVTEEAEEETEEAPEE